MKFLGVFQVKVFWGLGIFGKFSGIVWKVKLFFGRNLAFGKIFQAHCHRSTIPIFWEANWLAEKPCLFVSNVRSYQLVGLVCIVVCSVVALSRLPSASFPLLCNQSSVFNFSLSLCRQLHPTSSCLSLSHYCSSLQSAKLPDIWKWGDMAERVRIGKRCCLLRGSLFERRIVLSMDPVSREIFGKFQWLLFHPESPACHKWSQFCLSNHYPMILPYLIPLCLSSLSLECLPGEICRWVSLLIGLDCFFVNILFLLSISSSMSVLGWPWFSQFISVSQFRCANQVSYVERTCIPIWVRLQVFLRVCWKSS